ncbi:hypothetical protein PV08_04025 [Exophiala spinifera]|uniref:Uncharacterized protein n=1 Tax=Exophiala spinifera TaxID=91928 RepID=A0A0D2BE10_9EURO|nr:uncharacterized protein PV08_04025 [Exophiala spinifera]KIW16835.1 hypothetical protein PV08_04025 [Exophiala spinifera]
MVSYIYCGDRERSLRDSQLSSDETTGEAAEVSSRILSTYHAGEPLFSKEIIRDVARQLANTECRKVSVRGLDGQVVEIDVETGNVLDTGNPEWDYVM